MKESKKKEGQRYNNTYIWKMDDDELKSCCTVVLIDGDVIDIRICYYGIINIMAWLTEMT